MTKPSEKILIAAGVLDDETKQVEKTVEEQLKDAKKEIRELKKELRQTKKERDAYAAWIDKNVKQQ